MQKTQIAIIVLAVFLIVSIFFNLQGVRQQKIWEQDKAAAKKEITALSKQIEENNKDSRRLQERLKAIDKDLSKATQERDAAYGEVDAIRKERDELAEQLRNMPAPAPVEEQRPQAPPPSSMGDDTYWAGVLKAKTDLELQMNQLRSQLKDLEITNEQLIREKSNLELDIKNYVRQNDEMKQQAEYNQKIMDSISQDLVREKNSKMQIEDSAKVIKNENIGLRRQLKNLSAKKIELERRLAELQTKGKTLEDNFARMETLLKDKLITIEDLNSKLGMIGKRTSPQDIPAQNNAVELAPIVVRPQKEAGGATAVMGSAPQKAEVMLVNRENNFVIISIGEETGIRVGDVFQIYRDGDPIGSVEVIQVRRNFSACDIKKEGVAIRIGDQVK